jgi:hypothetical protein
MLMVEARKNNGMEKGIVKGYAKMQQAMPQFIGDKPHLSGIGNGGKDCQKWLQVIVLGR